MNKNVTCCKLSKFRGDNIYMYIWFLHIMPLKRDLLQTTLKSPRYINFAEFN